MKALFFSAILSCSLLSNAKDIKESNRDVSMQSKEQNVKDIEPSIDLSACGTGTSQNLIQSWLRLDDFSEMNAEHYEHDFEDFKKQSELIVQKAKNYLKKQGVNDIFQKLDLLYDELLLTDENITGNA